MSINSPKILSVLSTTLTLAAFLPGIAIAQLSIPDSTSAPTSTTAPTNPTPAKVNELSAQQRSAIQQALLRERNTRIIEILDEKQKNKFYEALRKRRRVSTALEDLKLSPEQENRVNAVISEYNNKMKAVATGQPLQSTQQTTPTTTAP
ncbi:MAG: hypothetical protein DSM106950_19210 [Stigonema ocellatum SAG 48.90 = DSM 106950]|nr:hypothetical protein [Stigonema ocellatum SAG 48.90 = DSM 106950]